LSKDYLSRALATGTIILLDGSAIPQATASEQDCGLRIADCGLRIADFATLYFLNPNSSIRNPQSEIRNPKSRSRPEPEARAGNPARPVLTLIV
jgi:hypothetical protein